MASRERVEFDVVGRDVSGSKTFRELGQAAGGAGEKIDDLGDQADRAGDKLDDLSGDAAQGAAVLKTLDAAADGARNSIRELAFEAARSGDLTLFKDINKQKREIAKLSELRNILTDIGEESADGFGAAFVGRLGPLLVRATPQALGAAGPPVMAVGAGMAAGLAALMGSAIGAGITGGVGVGGVIGGLAVASRHPAVQAEAARTGDMLGDMLERSAVAFVPAAVGGLQIVRSEILAAEDDLAGIFNRSATFVAPLARGAGEAVRSLAGGVRELVDEAGPVIDMLGEQLPEIADAVADGLADLSDNTASGAQALGILFMVVEAGTRAFFGLVDVLAETYGWMARFGAVVTGNHAGLSQLAQDNVKAKETGGSLSEELQGLLSGFDQVGSSASEAAAEVESFDEMLKRLQGETMSVERANLRLEESIDAATAAGRRNNDGIDANTAKGRANRSMLLDLAEAANASADAILETTGSQEMASQATERGRAAFLAAAAAMGVERGQAIELANQLFGIPNIKRTVTVDDADARRDINWLKTAISGIPRHIFIKAEFDLINDAEVAMAVRLGRLAEGGRVEGPGTGTSDDVIKRVSNGEYVIREGAARVLGYDFLDDLNQIDRTGGVRAPSSSRGGGLPIRGGGGEVDVDRLAQALRRSLVGLTLQIDDRTGRIVDGYARTG